MLPCSSVEVHYWSLMKSTRCSETSKHFTRRHFQSFLCCSATVQLGPRLPFFITQSYTHGQWDSSVLVISSSHGPLPTQSTTNTRDKLSSWFEPSGFQPAIPAIKPLQIYSLDHTATVIGSFPYLLSRKTTHLSYWVFEATAIGLLSTWARWRDADLSRYCNCVAIDMSTLERRWSL